MSVDSPLDNLTQSSPSTLELPQTSSNPDNIKTGARVKREQILLGATQVFLQHGYDGTSMDQVAKVAGVSKQTIYSHFQDKERLFTALIEQVTTRQFPDEFGQEALQSEPAELLRRIAEAYFIKRNDQEYLSLLRVVVAESARFPELAQLYTRMAIQPTCDRLSLYFESHPELNFPDPEAIAQIFLGSLYAFILSQEVLQGKHIMPIENERFINSLIQLCDKNCSLK